MNTQHTKVGFRFGEWLITKGRISPRELSEALAQQKITGERLGVVLQKLDMLSEEESLNALAEYLEIERIHLDDITTIDMQVARQLPENIAKRFHLVAVAEADDQVVVAMADPLNVVAKDIVRGKLMRDIKIVICAESEIDQAVEAIYHGSDVAEQQLRDLVQLENGQEDQLQEEIEIEDTTVTEFNPETEATKAPVVQFVDLLLSQAVKSRASDIHIEPQEKSMNIRMRIDGLLHEMVPPARRMQPAVIARIKILSKMDIAERRLPQDGRFKIKASGRDIDIRVSVIPVIYGEKVVLRILDSAAVNHDLDSLGLDPQQNKLLTLSLSQPHGIIIVTGPTGSGKSTTLYSALNYLRDPRKNITTVEDPVEYRIAGINQIQIRPEIDLDFAISLRSILRQDPDIIMIGEIRDKETVEIAMKASLTGHLVLSTFHTNDAPSSLSRLTYMGIEPYLLASTINLIVAQRLVRRICEHCSQPTQISPEILKELQISPDEAAQHTFHAGRGCKQCAGTGYWGRVALFEFLPLDKQLGDSLIQGASEAQIRSLARSKGHQGLLECGLEKMKQHITTAEEILAVTFKEDISQ